MADDAPIEESLRWLLDIARSGRCAGRRRGQSVKVRDVIRLIEADGWVLVAQRGSHRQYRHPTKPGRVTVAGKASTDVPPGTLGNIYRQAGLRGQQ